MVGVGSGGWTIAERPIDRPMSLWRAHRDHGLDELERACAFLNGSPPHGLGCSSPATASSWSRRLTADR
jgi:hypothetical protein